MNSFISMEAKQITSVLLSNFAMRQIVFLRIILMMLLTGKFILALQFKPRIVGGKPTKKNEFPFMVSLQTLSRNHFCGGSLITLSKVLTAAHCLYRDLDQRILFSTDQLIVVAGITSLQENGQTRQVGKMIAHEGFFASGNDIGILFLQTAFEDSIGVSRINLRNTPVEAKEHCTVIGWGLLEQNGGHGSDTLLKTEVTFIPLGQCSTQFSRKIHESVICAYQDKQDACQGDSGGPLICGGFLTGIVSQGRGCASKFPGLYSNVYYFRNWICNYKNVESASKSTKPRFLYYLLSLLSIVGGYLHSRLISL